jgi:peptidoglycan hydrolase CwlO-like protein
MGDDKLFELMSKMYSEMQDGFKKNDKRFDSVENDIKKLGAKIDGKLIPTSEALLDGYKDNAENITIIDDKIDRLQIDVNSITMKVSYNDSRIIEISKDIKKAK